MAVQVADKPDVFNPIETADAATVRALQEQLLREQLTYLRAHSVFYQKKLAAAGVDWDALKCIDDLEQVPFTMKQDLRDSLKAAPPFGEHLAADLKDIVQMQASSGTTGSPSYVALTASDLEQWKEGTARCQYTAGIRPGDRVLHGFSMSKGFVGGVPLFQGIQHLGALDIPIGADGGIDRLLVAARDMKPRCLIGTPNFLSYLGEAAPSVIGIAARDLGVEVLVVGGEPGGSIPALREKLESLWGARSCEALGGTDLGVVMFAECEHQRGMHAVTPDFVLSQIIDPDSGKVIPFEAGASGELVYTALGRRASPLLRFRTGDHINVIDTQCACGRTGPLIRCVGRTDDMLIVRGINLFPSAIQEVVAELAPQVTGIIRIVADFDGHSTQRNLKVLIERGDNADPAADAGLKEELDRRLRNRLSVKTDVTIVPADTFEKPGAQKVSILLRKMPDLDGLN